MKSFIFACACLLVGEVKCATNAAVTVVVRPTAWAVAVTTNPGLPNLYRINAGLYRSAQPSQNGFIFLSTQPSLSNADRPIKTIISLRAFNDDGPLLPSASILRLEQIRFKTWHPENEDVVKFLRLATAPALQPVLVHCLHGSDRTGTMVAIYRIVVDGWTKSQAIDEMVNGGYGFHSMWRNLTRYIEKLDVAAIKAELAKQAAWQPTVP